MPGFSVTSLMDGTAMTLILIEVICIPPRGFLPGGAAKGGPPFFEKGGPLSGKRGAKSYRGGGPFPKIFKNLVKIAKFC